MGDAVLFEMFELSPRYKDVQNCKGRLTRNFPSVAVQISMKTFQTEDFLSGVASTLARLSREEVEEMAQPCSQEENKQTEPEHPTKPALVTELFFNALAVKGKPVCKTDGICKNTRQEVVGYKGSRPPWTRSPTWLLLRVTLQLILERKSTDAKPGALYKRIMIVFMSHVLERALSLKFASELLYLMNAKIARRLAKLAAKGHEPWMPFVSESTKRATDYIMTRWLNINISNTKTLNFPGLAMLQVQEDLLMELPKLDDFISSMKKDNPETHKNDTGPKSQLLQFQFNDFPPVNQISETGTYRVYNLGLFEIWVAEHLGTWLQKNIIKDTTCQTLQEAIQKYHELATSLYQHQPEAISVMALTLLDLWIACDKSAVKILPLLEKYDPELPCDIWGPLMLRSQEEMKRLHYAEEYLKQRKSRQDNEGNLSLYKFGDSGSFSVKYVEKSEPHKNIVIGIKGHGEKVREERKKVWTDTRRQYDYKMSQSRELICDQIDDPQSQLTGNRHSPNCKRCKLREDAGELSVEIEDFPYPAGDLDLKSLAFELSPPLAFVAWRDATVFFLTDALKFQLSHEKKPAKPNQRLDLHKNLELPCQTPHDPRIFLASATKSRIRSGLIADTELSDICPASKLQWKYFDKATNSTMREMKPSDKLSHMCTFRMPQPAASMQDFIHRSDTEPAGVPPNVPIAELSRCPEHMSIEEFKALSSIPLGHRIQWANILKEMAMPSVDWKRLETALFVFQTSNQAGPQSINWIRESHKSLLDDGFADMFLEKMSDSLHRLRDNWDATRAIGVFTTLATRLLSVALREKPDACLDFLRRCRKTTHRWLNILQQELSKVTNDTQKAAFATRTFEAALVCVDSFNTEDEFFEQNFRSEDDVLSFLQCSMIIQASVSDTSTYDAFQASLLARRQKLAIRALHLLRDKILDYDYSYLNNAIRTFWQSDQLDGFWDPSSTELNCWVTSKSSDSANAKPRTLHFNLLTAELLVGELPLRRLPKDYERHAQYAALFSETQRDVIPGTGVGKPYMLRGKIEGCRIHLGLQDVSYESAEEDLLVTAGKDGRLYELVPCRVFEDKLPIDFIHSYVHWYNITDGVVELRHKDNPWPSDVSRWSWRLTAELGRWTLAGQGHVSLINNQSLTAEILYAVFEGLETRTRMHILHYADSGRVDVAIPRFQRTFYVDCNSTAIRCKELKGMRVDDSQVLETLVGLRNKLVLCQEHDTAQRILLAPQGVLSLRKREDDHIAAIIDHSTATRLQTYTIDRHLGRLLGSSLQSKLYLAYLHAVTSSCIPDAFTAHTGTEQALLILRSADICSFESLSEEDIELLIRISNLAPKRCLPKERAETIQVVTWNPNLNSLAQHEGLFDEAQHLLRKNKETRFLYPNCTHKVKGIDNSDRHLLERAAIRSSTFRVTQFGAEKHTTAHDQTYKSRDRKQDSRRSNRAYRAASSLVRNKYGLYEAVTDKYAKALYEILSAKPPRETEGPRCGLDEAQLGYNPMWLRDPQMLLPQYWCRIHHTFQMEFFERNNFSLLMWVATLGYADKCDETVMQILIAFVRLPGVQDIAIPQAAGFKLMEKKSLKMKLRTTVLSGAKKFPECPEGQSLQLKGKGKSSSAAIQRLKGQWKDQKTTALEAILSHITVQLQPPFTADIQIRDIDVIQGAKRYFNCELVKQNIQAACKAIKNNEEFTNYLQSICKAMGHVTMTPVTQHPVCKLHVSVSDTKPSKAFFGVSDVLQDREPYTGSSFEPSKDIMQLVSSKDMENDSSILELTRQLSTHATTRAQHDCVTRMNQQNEALAGNHAREAFLTESTSVVLTTLTKHRDSARKHFQETLEQLMCIVDPTNVERQSGISTQRIISATYQWPRFATFPFLSLLNRRC